MNYAKFSGYKLEKRTPGGDWEPATDGLVFGENATVGGLDEGETYEFRVSAVTDAGDGDHSLATKPTKAEKPKRQFLSSSNTIECTFKRVLNNVIKM